ncbi:MAG: class I SAM-dependent methyltransferase [Candidatus Omnitrophica bacterium]|nr:class I SAM-dependent methyltransferase [Candidatus Omnitrophota bacterium]
MKSTNSDIDFSDDYKQFGFDYFDNSDIQVGYGGYKYDGRYSRAVHRIAEHYDLQPDSRILEVGCAKGHVLLEFHKCGFNVMGVDKSAYGVENANEDIRNYVMQGDIDSLPFPDNAFDLVLGKEILPHVGEENIESAILECMRVSKGKIFFEIQCGRTQEELDLIKQWDCTHQTLQTPDWWESLFAKLRYPGDVHYKVLFPVE